MASRAPDGILQRLLSNSCDTLERPWQVVRPGGALVSVVSPHPSFEEAKAYDVRPFWFVVEPNREQLIQIGALIDAGKLRMRERQIRWCRDRTAWGELSTFVAFLGYNYF